MSGGAVCVCGKRAAWRVMVRCGNFSAFNGYRFTPSAYSEIVCASSAGGCGARWRSKAGYVATLPDASSADRSGFNS